MAKLNIVFVTFFLIFVIHQSSSVPTPKVSDMLDWSETLFNTFLGIANNDEVKTFASQLQTNQAYKSNIHVWATDVRTYLNKMDVTFRLENSYKNQGSAIKSAIQTFKDNFPPQHNNYLFNEDKLNEMMRRCKN